MASANTVPPKKLKNTKAWKITSALVRAVSKGICYTCNNPYPMNKLNAGHFIEKIGHAAIYFDLEGLRAQCFYCNRRLHGSKDVYAVKLMNEIGKKRVDSLFQRSRPTKLWTKDELEALYEKRLKLLERFRNLN